MTEWIEYRHIDKSYDDRPLIKDFNLTIEKGDFLCIVGTSGSGKTTLLKMINGLITPDRGEILIHGQPVSGGDLISLRRKIGYVIQGNGLFPHMSVAENIGYVLKLEHRDQAEIDAVVERLLRLVNLPESVKTKYPSELSGGQQQRVGIARALANQPDILLMDEPFGALDSITRYQLQQELKAIHQETGCTIVFITHDLREAFKCGRHILVMDKGEIQQYGTVEEIVEHPQNDFVKHLLEMAR